MDREAWQATIHGVAKESDTTSQLNNNLQHTRAQSPPTRYLALTLFSLSYGSF